jgi:hypothetical protein
MQEHFLELKAAVSDLFPLRVSAARVDHYVGLE